MRLIDADELKGRTTNFDEEGNRIWHKWDIDNAPTIMPKEFEPLVKAIIDVLPAIIEKILRPTRGWIPCSENTPEEEDYYLTTTIHNQVYCDYWNGVNFDRTEMVVAWMPLPEPYKEERKNEDND